MADLEKTYYKGVEKWLSEKYKCFKTAKNKGIRHSRADVIGIRDIGGELSGEIETIIIEVKRGSEAFATASGQTFGYTVYANRIYLADKRPDGFSTEEIQIASHLGIGLIAIDSKKACAEVLTSPYYRPLPALNMEFLETAVNLGKCRFCDNFFELGNEKHTHAQLAKANIDKALQNEQGVIFWNGEVADRKFKHHIGKYKSGEISYERRFLCWECVSLLGGLKNK